MFLCKLLPRPHPHPPPKMQMARYTAGGERKLRGKREGKEKKKGGKRPDGLRWDLNQISGKEFNKKKTSSDRIRPPALSSPPQQKRRTKD